MCFLTYELTLSSNMDQISSKTLWIVSTLPPQVNLMLIFDSACCWCWIFKFHQILRRSRVWLPANLMCCVWTDAVYQRLRAKMELTRISGGAEQTLHSQLSLTVTLIQLREGTMHTGSRGQISATSQPNVDVFCRRPQYLEKTFTDLWREFLLLLKLLAARRPC